MKKSLTCLVAGVCLSVSIYAVAAEKTELTPIQQVLNGSQRSKEHRHRDQYRHPEQTLAFFDVKPDMTVVEISPGEGWYTEILAPYLRDKGKLYAAHFSPESAVPYHQETLKTFLDKLRKQPGIYDKVEITALNPPQQTQFAPDGSADRVLTFRNVHNWMKNNQAASVFGAMFKALKPGGILGVVEHRGNPMKPQDPLAKSGYVTEDYIIDLARNAGFEFLAKSEINANPKDTKNHPEGVWTLPPTLRLKNKDKEKYLAIGESDRMTIKFMKPQTTALTSLFPESVFSFDSGDGSAALTEEIHKIK